MPPTLGGTPIRRALTSVVSAFALLSLTFVGALPNATPSAAQPVTARSGQVTPTARAYVDKKHRKATHTNAVNLRVSKSRYTAYLDFPAIPLAQGEAITSANLMITITKVSHVTKGRLEVRPISKGWNGSALTYNNRPKAGPVIGVAKLKKSGQRVKITLNAKASAYLAAGTGLQITRVGTKYDAVINASSAVLNYATGAATAPPAPQSRPAPVVNNGAMPGHPVFAHYFPPYPLSLDNVTPSRDYYQTQYLQPSGENGKFASVGGLLRDRPVGRAPISGDFELIDLGTEINQAKQAGLNGFAVDILSFSTSSRYWQLPIKLLRAADADGGFKVMLQPDMATLGGISSSDFAEGIATLSRYDSTYRDSNGAVIISPFYTEAKSSSWYADVLQKLKSQYNVKAVMLPLFLDASNMSQYASISIGFGNWGIRDPQAAATWTNWASKAHALGKLWMEPIAVQDVRPNQRLYNEAVNTNTLAATWNRAISQRADLVLMTTWNDYSESTSFAPSDDHGWAFLDLNRYFLNKFQSGSSSIAQEKLMIVHRIQKASTPVTYDGTMRLTGMTSATNKIQVVTLLKSTATVNVTIAGTNYSYTAYAGLTTKSFDLKEGRFTATATRYGATVLTVTTKDAVSFDTTSQQDLSYHAVVAGR